MVLFLLRALLWAVVLACMTLVWVAWLDAGPEGFQISLERNASLWASQVSGR
jgi:hypothetical protein